MQACVLAASGCCTDRKSCLIDFAFAICSGVRKPARAIASSRAFSATAAIASALALAFASFAACRAAFLSRTACFCASTTARFCAASSALASLSTLHARRIQSRNAFQTFCYMLPGCSLGGIL